MARPKKNTADYFPHLCNHGKKMAYIERRHGNDGYAVWYKVLEKLAQAHDHYLHLADEIEADFLADYCLVDIDKLTEIIGDLVKVGSLDPDAWKHKIIYSCTLLDSLGDLYVRRTDKPATLMQVITRVSGVSVDINSHSIGKDSKPEDNKGENLSPERFSQFETRAIITGAIRLEIIKLLKEIDADKWDDFIGHCDKLQAGQDDDRLKRFGPEKLIKNAIQLMNKPEKEVYENIHNF